MDPVTLDIENGSHLVLVSDLVNPKEGSNACFVISSSVVNGGSVARLTAGKGVSNQILDLCWKKDQKPQIYHKNPVNETFTYRCKIISAI